MMAEHVTEKTGIVSEIMECFMSQAKSSLVAYSNISYKNADFSKKKTCSLSVSNFTGIQFVEISCHVCLLQNPESTQIWMYSRQTKDRYPTPYKWGFFPPSASEATERGNIHPPPDRSVQHDTSQRRHIRFWFRSHGRLFH